MSKSNDLDNIAEALDSGNKQQQEKIQGLLSYESRLEGWSPHGGPAQAWPPTMPELSLNTDADGASASASASAAAAPASSGETTTEPNDGLTKKERRALAKKRAKERKAAGKKKAQERRKQKKLKEQQEREAAAAPETPAEPQASLAPEAAPLRQRKNSIRPSVLLQHDDRKKIAKYTKKGIVSRTRLQKHVPLFDHLPQYEQESSLSLQVGFGADEVHHPAIVRLGLRLADGTISGSTARCVAMLNAFKEFIRDYKTPPSKVLNRDLDAKLKPLVRFLIDCRPQSLAMGTVVRFLKFQIAHIPTDMAESEAKDLLISKIDNFIQERIEFADTIITDYAVSRIRDGDVVLTYSNSHVVQAALLQAYNEGKQFRVIVVDSRPKLEGKKLLKILTENGIQCSYILVSAVSYIMHEVSVVLFGAYAMLSNGSLVSRCGTAVIATAASRHKVPLLVCCETFKFHERVQIESISFNELGNPDDLIDVGRDNTKYGNLLADWREMNHLKLLNLMYDVTPGRFVSMVITEVGMIPPTSVPVILREYRSNEGGA